MGCAEVSNDYDAVPTGTDAASTDAYAAYSTPALTRFILKDGHSSSV